MSFQERIVLMIVLLSQFRGADAFSTSDVSPVIRSTSGRNVDFKEGLLPTNERVSFHSSRIYTRLHQIESNTHFEEIILDPFESSTKEQTITPFFFSCWKKRVFAFSSVLLLAAAILLPRKAMAAQFIPTTPLKFIPGRVELELTVRLLYASVFGGALGLDRSKSNPENTVGVRTMALVAMGACAFTICSTLGFMSICNAVGDASGAVKLDPSRLASSVVSGVGFIGAGAINTSGKTSTKGISTAAAVWIAASVGVATGTGLYFFGGVSALAAVGIKRFELFQEKSSQEVTPVLVNSLESREAENSLFKPRKTGSKSTSQIEDLLDEIYANIDEKHVEESSRHHLSPSPGTFSNHKEDLRYAASLIRDNLQTLTDANVDLYGNILREQEEKRIMNDVIR